jgi:hypothetical protein
VSVHEKIAARVARGLCTAHRIDKELYVEAERAFGVTGLSGNTYLPAGALGSIKWGGAGQRAPVVSTVTPTAA